jgi:hypothetical protein
MTIAMSSGGLRPYDVIGTFAVPLKAKWIFYGAGTLADPDVRGAVEGEVKKAGGDGAVNVVIRGKTRFGDLLITGILIDLYSQRTYTVEGEVIRYR